MPFRSSWLILVFIFLFACKNTGDKAVESVTHGELHRPSIHFTPKRNWMNDPNGMVFFNDRYHLFYQYYPDSTVWGPMHWGHASTTDLVNWQHHPVALYPDSLGYIFSGSTVADINNTSGFGQDGKIPLVAVFTHHDPVAEKEGRSDYQNQSIAYSLDEGTTWTKYAGNPVLKNPGIKDFRDPKVSWHGASGKWIMTLAVSDRVYFYSSPDLKHWTKESEFGKDQGAHGGVWECPDLFPMHIDGDTTWVLLVSINPGGPNGGSATQYFTGQFDGKNFVADDTSTKWIDYGPDNYAGVTWSNTRGRKIFLGWMSNWNYANHVPTKAWRSAMTIPRELSLLRVHNKTFLVSKPVMELDRLDDNEVVLENVIVKGEYALTDKIKRTSAVSRLEMKTQRPDDFAIVLANNSGNKLEIGFEKTSNRYYIDRTNAGDSSFNSGFAKRHYATRTSTENSCNLILVCDNASVELFADNGLTVMTCIFFPGTPLEQFSIRSAGEITISRIIYSNLQPAVFRNY